jgi:hypothetical protein
MRLDEVFGVRGGVIRAAARAGDHGPGLIETQPRAERRQLHGVALELRADHAGRLGGLLEHPAAHDAALSSATKS